MTEFIYTLTDERIKTKNNVRDIAEGDHIHLSSDEMPFSMIGIVGKIIHIIDKRHNGNGNERSTHDIVVEINPLPF